MKRRGLPKHVSEFQNRHKVWTLRFRRKGWPTVYPKSAPGTDEFAEEYRRWLARDLLEIGSNRTKPGSVRALAVSYFASPDYRSLKASTARVYRGIIERLCGEAGGTGIKIGDLPAAGMKREHVVKLMERRKGTAANRLRKLLHLLMRHAVETGVRKDDPTLAVRALKIKSDGFHSWTEAEIAQFEARHPAGTKARLALALLLNSGQRRGDVVRMGRQHVRDGFLHVRQDKTGAELAIPVLPELDTAIAEALRDNLTFLTTSYGKPFTSNGFGNWFRKRCDEAGLPHCSAHGLRKAAARRLAEIGCTQHEIAAITGHASLAEVQRYTKGADQKRLAVSAMAKIKNGTSVG
jgi:integrase